MTIDLTLNSGACLLSLGLLTSDQVEPLATIALAEGLDSPRLRQLAAGLKSDDDVRKILGAFIDGGLAMPSPTDAARTLAVSISARIVGAKVDPITAAADLALIARQLGPSFSEFDPFVYAWSEAESRPQEREFFRKAIIDEAETWVNNGRGSV